jgi:hypothetical protein
LKKLISILLFVSLLSPFAAIYICMKYQKILIKEEVEAKIKAGIDKGKLMLLKFSKEYSKKKLSWERDHEFEYNGQMYDIVETRVNGDTIYYLCWCDHEETEINEQVRELMARSMGNNTKDNEFHKRLVNFLKIPYFSGTFEWNPLSESGKSMCSFFGSGYVSTYISPPSPPPRIS